MLGVDSLIDVKKCALRKDSKAVGRYAANGFAFIPQYVPYGFVGLPRPALVPILPFKQGRPQSDQGSVALARFGSSAKMRQRCGN